MNTSVVDHIIVGAGVAGLYAAAEVSAKGKTTIVLEARTRIGGRIWTVESNFSRGVEGGAEFIHGDLKLSQKIFAQASIPYTPASGKSYTVMHGEMVMINHFDKEWNDLLTRLEQLGEDIPMGEFLRNHYHDHEQQPFVEMVKTFVEGYDAADIERVSAKALCREWKLGTEIQYRPQDGYQQLVRHLFERCKEQNTTVLLDHVVEVVEWRRGSVTIHCTNGKKFQAGKLLITVPLGILQTGRIVFDPPVSAYQEAFKQLGYGGVIKFLFEFRRPFWEDVTTTRPMPHLGFLFTDAFVPTWWTQHPDPFPLLTGWLAGPRAIATRASEKLLLEKAVASLAYTFGCSESWIKEQLHHAQVVDWISDPFTLGAYAYSSLGAADAIKLLTRPIDDTLYFAGEALYDGPEIGTVEAALQSAHRASQQMT